MAPPVLALRPLMVLARVLAAGIERETFPDWWPTWLCLGAVLRATKGCRPATGTTVAKNHRYTVVGVSFPEALACGEERYAWVTVRDTLDSGHVVRIQVRKRDLTTDRTTSFHGRIRANVLLHVDLRQESASLFAWPGPAPAINTPGPVSAPGRALAPAAP